MILGFHFLAVLDDEYFKHNLYETAKFIDNKADIIWYRFKNYKNLDEKLITLRKIVSKSKLILSSNHKLAVKYNFDGVHLNKQTIKDYTYIKNNTNLITGYSSHSPKEIDDISADYYTLSPIYDTPKEYKVNPIGIAEYNKSKKVFALGGINLDNLHTLKDNFYGFAGIRIVQDIINANF